MSPKTKYNSLQRYPAVTTYTVAKVRVEYQKIGLKKTKGGGGILSGKAMNHLRVQEHPPLDFLHDTRLAEISFWKYHVTSCICTTPNILIFALDAIR